MAENVDKFLIFVSNGHSLELMKEELIHFFLLCSVCAYQQFDYYNSQHE